MKVEQILQSKGAEVHAVSAAAPVRAAVDLLCEKNIGAVVVKDENDAVAGILSERDVVRRLKSEGPSVLDRPIRDCMTKDVVTCAPDTSIDALMSDMTNRRIRHIPVVDAGRLVGIVSIGDVVKRKIDDVEREAQMLKEYIAS